jgi:hypothetical protein
MNDPSGTILANAAIVPAGSPNGSIDIYVSSNSEVVIDINGYYALATGMTLASGTVGAPPLSFSDSANTGIFSSSTGNLDIAANGFDGLTVRGSDGDLDIHANIRRNGFPFIGYSNASTSVGSSALSGNTGFYNDAFGLLTLASGNSGEANSAFGEYALNQNTTGSYNAAFGGAALRSNRSGSNNSAFGFGAGVSIIGSSANTAVGAGALGGSPMGASVGSGNTAVGDDSLNDAASATAAQNTAVGQSTLGALVNGCCNVALGYHALANTDGNSSVGVGLEALRDCLGQENIAIGPQAARLKSFGNQNIYIGENVADDPNNMESSTIRIGDSGYYNRTFIGGVRNVITGANDAIPVVIDSHGQLGTTSSSRRYKDDIQDMGDASSGLMRLRPVTYRYQQPYANGARPVDYGLIAEEVADVYPNLVTHLADGEVETVQYQKLTPMLLNELQKADARVERQAETIRQQAETIRQQSAAMRQQAEQIRTHEDRLAAVERLLKISER